MISKKNGDGSHYCVIAGVVVKDAEFSYTKNKHTPQVVFPVNYDKKKYMNCKALGEKDVTQLASKLEQNDVVVCFGKITTFDYISKNGEEKQWTELLCDAILPQTTGTDISATLESTNDTEDLDTDYDDDYPF